VVGRRGSGDGSLGDRVASPFTTGEGHWAVVVEVVEALSDGTNEGLASMMTVLVVVEVV